MTKVVEQDGIRYVCIEAEEDDICEMCGALDELRPYGPGGMRVCFECAMKDEAEATRRFNMLINGEPNA